MPTQTPVVANVLQGPGKEKGGCRAGADSLCPCFLTGYVAGFLLTRVVKGKLFIGQVLLLIEAVPRDGPC